MKTTLNLDDEILKSAKRRALEDDISLTRLLENALRQYLEPASFEPNTYCFEPLIREGKIIPGVDLEDRDSLYDRMDDLR